MSVATFVPNDDDRRPGQAAADAHITSAGPAASAPDETIPVARPNEVPSRRVADALLLLYADTLNDVEQTRISMENRLRSLLSGELWGKGVNPHLPEVTVLQGLLAQLQAIEHGAELVLKRAMRAHPLGPWVKGTIGVGEKQAARLLAAIGDPGARPNVAKLWAFCGLHVIVPDGQLPTESHLRRAAGDDPLIGQTPPDAQWTSADDGHPGGQCRSDSQCASARGVAPYPSGGHGTTDSHGRPAAAAGHPGDQPWRDAHMTPVAGVAPSRKRGQKANWSGAAKMRVYLVAESCIKQARSPYRVVYDAGRLKYADAVHAHPCSRCGPSGHPAPVGSPLSLGHQHARAMRLVMKEILKDLWVEARRCHG